MDLRVIETDRAVVLEGPPATALLRSPDDVVELIGACYEHQAELLLLYAENLTEHFFDLSSGEAGAILQKLRNYRLKAAVVLSPGATVQSNYFKDMAREERHGGDFAVFDDRDAALAWLLGRPSD